MKNITCIGGATGPSCVLSGLKKYNYKLSAIFPITDDGGSTGRLIKDYNLLPIGDARRLIISLSKNENALTKMLDYRFEKGELKGHVLGNIMLTALFNMTGNIDNATSEITKLLDIKHNILPSSLNKSTLCAKLENNQNINGENNIDEVIGFNGNIRIKQLFLNPKVKINPEARKIIKNSDLIVLGPGDLHTSIIPNILVSGMPKAIKYSNAKIIYVCNLMTKFGQTNNFKVSDFVSEIDKYLGKNVIDYVIFNTQKPPVRSLNSYKKEREFFVEADYNNFNDNYSYLPAKLLSNKIYIKNPGDTLKRSLIRHDSNKLAKIILSCK